MTSKILEDALRGKKVDRVPCWVMRQAGRYLPEYHELKDKAGGFLNLCKIPEFAVQAVMQPMRRFDFDAAIIFADILLPAEAMGMKLNYNPGPYFESAIRGIKDVESLKEFIPDESMPFTKKIIRQLLSELKPQKTLIGFAGAPFTVALYMVEGKGSSKDFITARSVLYDNPRMFVSLLEKVTKATISYLKLQIDAGVHVVQLFDSLAGYLSMGKYQKLAAFYAKKVVDELAEYDVPIIYFAPGAMTSLSAMNDIGADCIGLDWRLSISKARKILGNKMAVQGNLDPAVLLGKKDEIALGVKNVLRENNDRPGFVFNLGHGILPQTPVENVEHMMLCLRG